MISYRSLLSYLMITQLATNYNIFINSFHYNKIFIIQLLQLLRSWQNSLQLNECKQVHSCHYREIHCELKHMLQFSCGLLTELDFIIPMSFPGHTHTQNCRYTQALAAVGIPMPIVSLVLIQIMQMMCFSLNESVCLPPGDLHQGELY